jgi:hypothetical protein
MCEFCVVRPGSKSNKSTKAETKADPKPEKMTKKSVCVELVSRKGGATVDEMAAEIVTWKIDPDLEKSKRVVRAWLTKLGIPVKRNPETGKYQTS